MRRAKTQRVHPEIYDRVSKIATLATEARWRHNRLSTGYESSPSDLALLEVLGLTETHTKMRAAEAVARQASRDYKPHSDTLEAIRNRYRECVRPFVGYNHNGDLLHATCRDSMRALSHAIFESFNPMVWSVEDMARLSVKDLDAMSEKTAQSLEALVEDIKNRVIPDVMAAATKCNAIITEFVAAKAEADVSAALVEEAEEAHRVLHNTLTGALTEHETKEAEKIYTELKALCLVNKTAAKRLVNLFDNGDLHANK